MPLIEHDFERICTAIESGKCLAFIGAGACTSFSKGSGEEVKGLPTAGELAAALALECKCTNGRVLDLTRVAEYFLYSKNDDREALEKVLRRHLDPVPRCIPRPIHTVLAQLTPIKFIITSNYDTLLENELRTHSRNLIKNVYELNNTRAGLYEGKIFFGEQDQNDLILHKMHGCLEVPKSLIITRYDYIRYLANLYHLERGMPNYFRTTIIPNFTLLFLGYSLEDWNFQVIWEGVLANQANTGSRRKAFAFMKNPDPFQMSFWRDRNVEIFDCDLTDFSVKLAEYFRLDIPQLNIEKGVQK